MNRSFAQPAVFLVFVFFPEEVKVSNPTEFSVIYVLSSGFSPSWRDCWIYCRFWVFISMAAFSGFRHAWRDDRLVGKWKPVAEVGWVWDSSLLKDYTGLSRKRRGGKGGAFLPQKQRMPNLSCECDFKCQFKENGRSLLYFISCYLTATLNFGLVKQSKTFDRALVCWFVLLD